MSYPMARGIEAMTSDMKNLLMSFIFFAGFFLFIGIMIGNNLEVKNDMYFSPPIALSLIGFIYSTIKVMKPQ